VWGDLGVVFLFWVSIVGWGGREEEVEAPSATICHGFRLPSLRDCAGMTGRGGGAGMMVWWEWGQG